MTSAMEAARGLRAELSPRWGMMGPYQWGKVNAKNASPPSVDVYLDGSTTLTLGLRYLSSYEPVVNDVVLVGRMQGSAKSARIVIGSIAIVPRYPDLHCQITNLSAGNSGGIANATFVKAGLSVAGADGDPAGMGNTTTSKITVPIPGMYLVGGTISWTTGANAGRFLSVLYKNGAELTTTRASVQLAGAQTYNVPAIPMMTKCAANDYFEMYGWQGSGVGTPIFLGQGSDFCSLTVQFISPL